MTIQKCVRTYEENFSVFQNNPCATPNCEVLNSYLEKGWKVVMVTPKPRYNEYIIEKGEDDQLAKATELLKQWRQTTYAGGCDNVNLGIETEQFLKEIEK